MCGRVVNKQPGEGKKRKAERKNSTYDIKVNDTGDRKLPVEEEGTGMGKKERREGPTKTYF